MEHHSFSQVPDAFYWVTLEESKHQVDLHWDCDSKQGKENTCLWNIENIDWEGTDDALTGR